MILLQALISYEAYKWQIWLVIGLFFAMVAIAVFYMVKSKLLDKYVEFENDSTAKENQLYIVDDGIKEKVFYTPNGALIYTTALFSKRGQYPKIYFCENDVKTEITANCLRRAIHNKNAWRNID